MADQFDEFDDDYASDDEGPANLRKALKRAERERKALLDELNQFKQAQREQSIKSVLESEGVNTKIARFIPSDVSSPEQVKAWLNEYADVFGGAAPSATAEERDPRADEMAKLNNVVNTASQPSGSAEDLLRKVQSVSSLAELNELTGNLPARFQRS